MLRTMSCKNSGDLIFNSAARIRDRFAARRRIRSRFVKSRSQCCRQSDLYYLFKLCRRAEELLEVMRSADLDMIAEL